jgi:hypothetical protein
MVRGATLIHGLISVRLQDTSIPPTTDVCPTLRNTLLSAFPPHPPRSICHAVLQPDSHPRGLSVWSYKTLSPLQQFTIVYYKNGGLSRGKANLLHENSRPEGRLSTIRAQNKITQGKSSRLQATDTCILPHTKRDFL